MPPGEIATGATMLTHGVPAGGSNSLLSSTSIELSCHMLTKLASLESRISLKLHYMVSAFLK